MKRIFLAVLILLVAGVVFAQQVGTANRPTSTQTRETANQFLGETRSNSNQFDSAQADLNARNVSNLDAFFFNQLRNEILTLESSIREEHNRIAASLDRGIRVNQENLDRIQRMIDLHKAKITELETFTSAR